MMEALASGCGFTGTRVGGIGDYERHPLAADCLMVYAVGDIEDAVSKINNIAAVPRTRRKQSARKLAESEFSIQVCLEKYFNAIDAIPTHTATPRHIILSPLAMLYSKLIAKIRYWKLIGKQ